MIPVAQLRMVRNLLAHEYLYRRVGACPYCGPAIYASQADDEIGLRCMGCSAGIVQVAIGWALREKFGSLKTYDVCELSSKGVLAHYLRRRARSACLSEYFDDVPAGSYHQGTRCEDVQQLTYASESFDLVTHTEVLEHVPDDLRALRELRRVLRRGGYMLCTLPVHDGPSTIERARRIDDAVEYLLPPVYHDDPLRAEGALAYRDYGADVLERFRVCGFADVRFVEIAHRTPWRHRYPVILARRPQ